VVDGVGRHCDLPPRLFRGLPLSYIGYPPGTTGCAPNFHFSASAIAETALRELAVGMPPCYAAVGFPNAAVDWSRLRVRAFRAAVLAAGARCRVFPGLPHRKREEVEPFVARLAPWLARLPEHCAVFAVSDETAALVARAARLAGRNIPRSLTLLSVDNFTDICEGAIPPISSIQLDFEREGYMATKMLGDEIPSGDATVQRRRIECGRLRPRVAGTPAETAGIFTIGPLLTVRRRSTAGRGRREKFVLDAIDIIRREATDGLTPASLIARFPVSKSLFNLRFREAVGHSVRDEIEHVRLERVFTLLAETDMPLGIVSDMCGFGSEVELRQIFRKRTKMSMTEWRALRR
jgi:LacI family transcriptional regulator